LERGEGSRGEYVRGLGRNLLGGGNRVFTTSTAGPPVIGKWFSKKGPALRVAGGKGKKSEGGGEIEDGLNLYFVILAHLIKSTWKEKG